MRQELSPQKITSLILLIARDFLGFTIRLTFFEEPTYILNTKDLIPYIKKEDPETQKEKLVTKKELDVINDLLDRSVRIEWLVNKKQERRKNEAELSVEKVEGLFTMAAALIGYELAIHQNSRITNITIVGNRLLSVHGEELPSTKLIEHLRFIDDLVWKTIEIDEKIETDVKLGKKRSENYS